MVGLKILQLGELLVTYRRSHVTWFFILFFYCRRIRYIIASKFKVRHFSLSFLFVGLKLELHKVELKWCMWGKWSRKVLFDNFERKSLSSTRKMKKQSWALIFILGMWIVFTRPLYHGSYITTKLRNVRTTNKQGYNQTERVRREIDCLKKDIVEPRPLILLPANTPSTQTVFCHGEYRIRVIIIF